MKDFFISYNSVDAHWARGIASWLEEAGYSSIMQEADFRPGGNFVLEMDKAATSATRTIAVLSPDFLSSSFTPSEWAAAFARDPKGEHSTLIPVRVRECELTGLLAQIIHIDLVGLDAESAHHRFLSGIHYALDGQPPTTAASPPRKRRTRSKRNAPKTQTIHGDGNIQVGGDAVFTQTHTVRNTVTPRPTDITEEQHYEIKQQIHELAKIDEEAGLGNTHGKWTNRFKKAFKLTSTARLEAHRFDAAMQWFRETIGRERNKLYGKNTEALKKRLRKAVHGKRAILGMSKPELYALVEQRLGKPISSVSDLGVQGLRKLDRILQSMLNQ